MEPKEARQKRKEMVDGLKEDMDENLHKAKGKLDEATVKLDADQLWKVWSKAFFVLSFSN